MTTGDVPHISGTNYGEALAASGLAYAALAGGDLSRRIQHPAFWQNHQNHPQHAPAVAAPTPEKPMTTTTCRLVKVFIADADENVPLANRLLFSGVEKLTDLTDQELFFEVPLTDILAKHNELRVTLVDKKAKTATERVMLEPIRIRDLKMVVVSLANF